MTVGTIIVGAGPAGLAAAAVHGRGGTPYAVLDRGSSLGEAWRARYDCLQLHTVRWLSGLPGARIPRRFGRWVRRDDFVAYLEDYARRFDVRPELRVEVTRIDRSPAGWRLETSAGTREAAAVVVATGYSRAPRVPDWPGADSFPGPFLHSSAYREPSPYRGRHVLVVGAGNSAAEIALDLTGVAGRVDLSVRTPPNIVRRDTLGIPSQLFGIAFRRAPERLMNPVSAALRRLTVPDLSRCGLPAPPGDGFTQFLRTRTVPVLDHGFVAAVRVGRIHVVPAVRRFDGPEVLLADGRVVRPDAVIAATGFDPDLGPLVGHLGVLDDSGLPRAHGPSALPHTPGLHFVGMHVELAGLLREIGREARRTGGVTRGIRQSPRT